MTANNTNFAPVASYTHETMNRKAFRRYVASTYGKAGVKPTLNLKAHYEYVEYLNSPAGLLILAHRKFNGEQVDGIHPATISHSIESFRNIIEPLSQSDAPNFNAHYMTRRSQGGLILKAFGRMIDGGDPEAHSLTSETYLQVEVFAAPYGPLIGVIDREADTVYVVRPDISNEMKVAA